jgi:hypothetical protein
MANAAFIHATPGGQTIRDTRRRMMRNVSEPLLIACVFLPLAALTQLGMCQPVGVQPPDPTVTSDSTEYCDVLLNKFTGLARTAVLPPPTEAALLSEEGERMCVHGQIRGGIMRLRRALMILRHGED